MRAKLIVFLIHCFSKLPLRLSRGIARIVGTLACLVSARGYRVTQKNLEMVYPELSNAERKAMAVQSMKESAQMAMETPAVWFRGETWRQTKTLSVVAEEKLLKAKDTGRGVLVLMPHFGNWEMAGIHVAQSMKSTAMYAPPKLAALDAVMRAGRFAAEMVPANAKGVMKVFKALKRGEMTLILPDQVPAEEGGIFAPFFDKPAFTMTLIQKLVQKTNPVVLVVYAIRRNGGFDLGYMDPDPAIYSADDQEAVSALNRTIETLVEKAPTQYQWEYKHYRKQPDGISPYNGF